MPFPLLITLVAFLAIPITASADEPKPSPAVKRILDEAVREVRKNRMEFDKANEKPFADARQELKDLSTKLIKDGKNMEAQAVLKQIDTLDADVMKMANAPAPMVVGGGKVVPPKPFLERMAGKWDSRLAVRVINADGTYQATFKGTGTRHSGRVRELDSGHGELLLDNPQGWRAELRPAGEDHMVVLSFDPLGKRDENDVWERVADKK